MLRPVSFVISGRALSGSVAGFFVARELASGSVGVFDLGSGAVTTGQLGSGAVQSGNLASGSVGVYHFQSGLVTSGVYFSGSIGSGQVGRGQLASGAVSSGTIVSGAIISGNIGTGSPTGSLFLRDDLAWASPPGGALASGSVQSGHVASGAIQGFYGSTRHIASGTVGVWDLGSGAVVAGSVGSGAVQSGNVASGALGLFHLQSGLQLSGLVLSGGLGSGQVGVYHLQSGLVTSGLYLSGSIGSGQIGRGQLASGAAASGVIVSGAIVSGSLGFGSPTGTTFLRDDFSWQAVTATIGSGSVGSGAVASGTVPGFYGPYRGIMSGTVGVFDLGSGAVVTGTVGSGAVQSGQIASGSVGQFHHASGSVNSGVVASGAVLGQVGGGAINIASGTIGTNDIGSGQIQSGNVGSGVIGSYHFASGAVVDRSQYVLQFVSGIERGGGLITAETISGIRGVMINQSGNVQMAMASVSGRYPAVGVVVDNVVSGIQVNLFCVGSFQSPASGLLNFSGYVGLPVYLGRSGQLVSVSGFFNSGGLLSGDVTQPIGVAMNSGGVAVSVAAALPFVVSLIYSGNIGSGQVGQAGLASGALQSGQLASGAIINQSRQLLDDTWVAGETLSGLCPVAVNSGSVLVVAQGASGLRMPAVGVANANYVSGASVQVVLCGRLPLTSGMYALWSGKVGVNSLLFVSSSGDRMTPVQPTVATLSQVVGFGISGGIYVMPNLDMASGGSLVGSGLL